MTDNCLICQRVALWRAGQNPYLIAEFEHSLFVVCDHQYYRGYALLLLKDHIRDLHQLPPDVQAGLFAELMRATAAVVSAYHPDKMNHLSLGNAEPHIHWHIIPRYADDPYYRQQPFAQAAEFDKYAIDAATAQRIAAEIRAHLA